MMMGVSARLKVVVLRFLRGAASFLLMAGCTAHRSAPGALAKSVGLPGGSAALFDMALQRSLALDARRDWRVHDCAEVADQFREAWRRDPKLSEALFNASLAELRCQTSSEPRLQALSSVEMRPRAYQGVVRLTPLGARRTPEQLERELANATAASAAASGDATSFVALASLYIERGFWSSSPSASTRDFAVAEGYLDAALVIDERDPAARNELALLHLAKAKQLASSSNATGSGTAPVEAVRARSSAELERAFGLALQVVREHPTYAAARNTLGLVSYELRDASEAVRQFALATELAPRDVEAYTNLGAALLLMRSFAAAERAYERALALREDAYEAHLGRAQALGGQIDELHLDAQLARIEVELEHCKQLAPERPEAYYSQAWLNLDWTTKSASERAKTAASTATSLFDTFIAKAGMAPAYAEQVHSARAKLGELRARAQRTR